MKSEHWWHHTRSDKSIDTCVKRTVLCAVPNSLILWFWFSTAPFGLKCIIAVAVAIGAALVSTIIALLGWGICAYFAERLHKKKKKKQAKVDQFENWIKGCRK